MPRETNAAKRERAIEVCERLNRRCFQFLFNAADVCQCRLIQRFNFPSLAGGTGLQFFLHSQYILLNGINRRLFSPRGRSGRFGSPDGLRMKFGQRHVRSI